MTHRKTQLAALAAVSLTLSAAPALPALAQHADQQNAQQGQTPTIFNLNFPGGPLSEFLAAVRSAHPGANIVAPEAADDFPLPPMQLRNITLEAAMQLIEGNENLPSGQTARLGVQSFPIRGSFDPAIRVWHDVTTQSRWGELKSSVWSLAENLSSGRSSEDLLGAVQVALATFPVESNIRYHEPTSLLIVRGTEEQLSLVDQTLSQLRGDVNRAANGAQAIRGLIRNLESELIESQAHLRVAEKRVQLVRNEFAAKTRSAEDQVKNGAASEYDVEMWLGEAELRLVEAEADFEIAQNQVRQLVMRLDEESKRLESLTRGSSDARAR